MQLWVFWRAASVPFVRQRITLKQLILSDVLLWALFLFGRVVNPQDSGFMAAAN
ncbi:MAG: hypothetical protein PHP85_12080 [Gallionella sp.]|nr:hypothetical protein [Gallionella sp.]